MYKRQENYFPLFIGDGINDVAAMSVASGSIAMNSGAGLARSAAMGVMSADRIEVIPKAITFAKSVQKNLRTNLFYAAMYNSVGIILAATGFLTPIVAALIMLCSSFFIMIRVLSVHPKLSNTND